MNMMGDIEIKCKDGFDLQSIKGIDLDSLKK